VPLGDDYLKIDIDGAFRKEMAIGACRFIIRNCRGDPVMAGAANVSPMRDALMAETMACQFALEAAEIHGISRIELETDSALLREALITNSRDLEPEGALFRSIRDLLANQFRCDIIRNVPCSCNSVVHEITKVGMCWDIGQSDVWLDLPPEFVNSLVAHDLAEQLVLNPEP